MPKIEAVDQVRRTIYHSPQSPGYTCWVGAWTMPDDSIMACFTQATGPPAGRPRAPEEVRHKLDWPPAENEGYDMTGLELRNVHLRSWDGGETWQQVSADPFRSCMNGITGEAEVARGDGAVVRGVWGYYLPYDPQLPQTGYVQLSTDGTRTWGSPQLLLDPDRYTAWPKRLRLLRDGRLIAIGGWARVPANSRTRREYSQLMEPMLLVSADGGDTWSDPIDVLPKEHRGKWGGEEYDAVELASGDLLCVFRRLRYDEQIAEFTGGEVRWQGLLKKDGETWRPTKAHPAPFPHSGHPELLGTREGVVLHIATSGVHWTEDAGVSWHQLEGLTSGYYPRSVQAANGHIYIFWHAGGDDAYGKVDQRIGIDRFRLQTTT